MRKILCLLLLLALALPACAEERTAYRGDGRSMLTVTVETAVYAQPGEAEQGRLAPGQRIIALGGSKDGWYPVYVPLLGYGYVPAEAALADGPRQLAYSPGFGVSAPLFTVEDHDQVRVEIVSLDGLEYPVITLQRVFSLQQADGSWQLCASFATAPDVCKTTSESLCATLYTLDGQPIEVLTIAFDAPLWR